MQPLFSHQSVKDFIYCFFSSIYTIIVFDESLACIFIFSVFILIHRVSFGYFVLWFVIVFKFIYLYLVKYFLHYVQFHLIYLALISVLQHLFSLTP